MFYLIAQLLLVCLVCLFLGLVIGYILWGTRARQRSQERAELAEQHRIILGLQEQQVKDKRRMTELEASTEAAQKLAAKKEASVSQLIADKGSLLADVRTLEKEIAKLKSGEA
jgi:hypothetical protein